MTLDQEQVRRLAERVVELADRPEVVRKQEVPMPYQRDPRTKIMRHQLLTLGENERMWWCPDCGEIKAKAQFNRGDQRGHSSHCMSGLVRVNVTVSEVSA